MFCCMKKKQTKEPPSKEEKKEKKEKKIKKEKPVDTSPKISIEPVQMSARKSAEDHEETESTEEEKETESAEEISRPENYDEMVREAHPVGYFSHKDGDTNPFSTHSEASTTCFIHPDCDYLKWQFLKHHDINPEDCTAEEFDTFCREEGFWNALGGHDAYCKATHCENIEEFRDQVNKIREEHQVGIGASDNFCGVDKNSMRAIIITGGNREDSDAAAIKYLKLLKGKSSKKDSVKQEKEEKEEKKAEPKNTSEFDKRCAKVLAGGDDTFDQSSCQDRIHTFVEKDPNGIQVLYNMYRKANVNGCATAPGLTKLSDNLYEYKIFVSYHFPLHKIPIKRYNKACASKRVAVLEKKKTVIFKGSPVHVLSIIGPSTISVIKVRNYLKDQNKAFASAMQDVQTCEDLCIVNKELFQK